MSKRHNPQEKASIVTEFFTTNISAAEMCRKHNVSPATSKTGRKSSSREASRPSQTREARPKTTPRR